MCLVDWREPDGPSVVLALDKYPAWLRISLWPWSQAPLLIRHTKLAERNCSAANCATVGRVQGDFDGFCLPIDIQ